MPCGKSKIPHAQGILQLQTQRLVRIATRQVHKTVIPAAHIFLRWTKIHGFETIFRIQLRVVPMIYTSVMKVATLNNP